MLEQRVGNDAVGKLTRILDESESILQPLRLAFKGTWHQSLLGKEADQTEEGSITPAKPPGSPLAGGSPSVGRDEYDITVEPDEKPETCDDLLCDVSIKPPRKLKRPHSEQSHASGRT